MKTEGRLAAFAKHPWFERTTMSVIFLNAIWISIDIEFNKADIISEADAGFVLVENLFCTYFTLELLIRYCLYKKTSSAFKDGPFHYEAAFMCSVAVAVSRSVLFNCLSWSPGRMVPF